MPMSPPTNSCCFQRVQPRPSFLGGGARATEVKPRVSVPLAVKGAVASSRPFMITVPGARGATSPQM